MVAEVIVVATLVAKLAPGIGLFEKIAAIYAWLKKVASTEWKEELDNYIEYLQLVKGVTSPYETSNCSETSPIARALKRLDRELEKSWSKVDKWIETKKFRADDIIKQLNISRAKIDQNLQLFRAAVQAWEKEEEEKRKRKSQRKKEKEREREETKYKAELIKNVTKFKASWTSYKERATNSKLDPAEKERLFRKHKKRLRKKYQQYWQLLNEVIKPELENKYLTSWSAAERLLQGHQRFDQFPERVRKREWRSHVEQISKKSHKTKRGTSGEKGKQQ